MTNWVTACLLHNEPTSDVHVLRLSRGRWSRSESESEEGASLRGAWDGVDPKPRELPMARVKVR
jgi:hypothetical protein